VTTYDHVAAVQRVVIPLGNVCHALVLFGKEKLCSITKEAHKFSQSKLVYLFVVITLLLHPHGEITAVFDSLSILTLFDWLLANNVSFSSASFLGFLEVV
jgi:hypothetical protein